MATPETKIKRFIETNVNKQRDKYQDGYANNLFEWEQAQQDYEQLQNWRQERSEMYRQQLAQQHRIEALEQRLKELMESK